VIKGTVRLAWIMFRNVRTRAHKGCYVIKGTVRMAWIMFRNRRVRFGRSVSAGSFMRKGCYVSTGTVRLGHVPRLHLVLDQLDTTVRMALFTVVGVCV
jgi:hypothetical protein